MQMRCDDIYQKIINFVENPFDCQNLWKKHCQVIEPLWSKFCCHTRNAYNDKSVKSFVYIGYASLPTKFQK